ncbi:MAG: NADH-quinone oxidoreductase subunit H, partial [Candidatus Acidiferrum sp.]
MSASLTSFLSAHATIIIYLVKIALLLFIVLTVNAYLTWFERKVVAHMQSRWGPHRVGPHGLLQPAADGLKFLLKEDPTPAGVDKFTYFLAPLLSLALALTSIAIIPFGPEPLHIFGHDVALGITNLNIGILALFAITALSVYGVVLAGWSSNSKYPLLGGLRSSAQMVSYELALTMSVVGVLLMAGSFNLRDIIGAQAHHPELGVFGWNVWPQILGFFCFFVAAIAETNRVPFDLPEAESELVAGFHTEYASFKFAMFFIAEYTSMITVSCLCAIMFFGGWLSPFPASWTFTYYLPSAILIPFGLWVIWDGIRYETIFGRIVLPGIGTVLTVIGIALAVPQLQFVNVFIQGPFWLLAKIFLFLFVYVWMRG